MRELLSLLIRRGHVQVIFWHIPGTRCAFGMRDLMAQVPLEGSQVCGSAERETQERNRATDLCTDLGVCDGHLANKWLSCLPMGYGIWKTESLQSPLSSPSDSWSALKCNSNKNNFISKLVLRGGFQFAALPYVTIKDFSTKQFILKILIFFSNLSDVFSEKQTPLFTDCLSYWWGEGS